MKDDKQAVTVLWVVGLGSCPVAGFGIGGVGSQGYTAVRLLDFHRNKSNSTFCVTDPFLRAQTTFCVAYYG
jgi:hypothetical protein